MYDTPPYRLKEDRICIDRILLREKLPASSFIKSMSVDRGLVSLVKYLLLLCS